MTFFYSMLPEAEYQGIVLTDQGADHRLISYAFARQCPPDFLKSYVYEGFVLSAETEALVAAFSP